MRGLFVVAVCTAAACTCLQPVVETLDGGAGGGAAGGNAAGGAAGGGTAGGNAGGGAAGGGTAGGAVSGCTTFADCTGPKPSMSLCPFVSADGGFSCIDHACVFDCRPDRTCDTAFDAGCLDCGTSRTCEAGLGCGTTSAAVVEADNGCPWTSVDLTLTPVAGVCAWTATDTSTGRALGVIYRLSDGSYVAHLPELGGTCTGMSLATQVERWMFSCPACQFDMRL